MVKFIQALCLLLTSTAMACAGDLLTRPGELGGDWKTVKQTLSEDQKSLDVVIETDGILLGKIQWNYPKCEKVTLLMSGKRACEGLNLRPIPNEEDKKQPEGFARSYELKSTKGMKVEVNPEGVKIVFTGEGLRLLSEGGQLQYIDYYRR